MAAMPPADVVRLLFEARAAGDDRQLVALMAPGVTALPPGSGNVIKGVEGVRAFLRAESRPGSRRTEVQAHRIVADGNDVLVHGRIRIFDDNSLSDSPASWRFTVVDGLIERIVPLTAHADTGRGLAVA